MREVKIIDDFGKVHLLKEDGSLFFIKGDDIKRAFLADNGAGYLSVYFNRGRKYIHRLVAEYFCEKPSEEHTQVNHKDGDKSNNVAYNLEWVTPKENIKHAHEAGLMVNRGKVDSVTRRSDEDVAALYRDIKEGMGVAEAARKHGFQRTTASSINNKRSRISVTDPIDREYELV